MATQYQNVNNLPSSTYRDYVLSQVGLFDRYVLYQSGQYEYTAYIWNKWGRKTVVTISRVGANTSYHWRSEVQENVQHSFTITEPMYCYSSNSEYGIYTPNPQLTAAGSYASMLIFVSICVIFIYRAVWKK